MTTLWAITATNQGSQRVTAGSWEGFYGPGCRQAYVNVVSGMAASYDTFVSPAVYRDDEAVAAACFWVETRSGRQTAALARFRPRPTIVLQVGATVRHVALWALARQLRWNWIERGNHRLAHHVGATKKLGNIDVMIPAPGTTLRKHTVACVELRTEALYEPVQVVGRLRDAPTIRH